MTRGKGIGGGVPLSAILASKAASCFEYGDQGGTYCGNPLVCAVGLAVMRTLIDPDFLAMAAHNAAFLREGLTDLSSQHGLGETRGSGFLLALEVAPDTAPAIVARAMQVGLLINAPRPNCLRLTPALNISLRDIETGLERLDEVI